MKRTFFYAALGLSLAMASCKETVTPTSNSSGTLAEDTTYVESPVEPAEKRKVLIEELTGVTCVNCPDGAKKLKEMLDANPDGLVVMSYHTGIFSDPIPGKSKQNLQTTEARSLREKLWGSPNAYPTALFDRIPINTGTTTPLYVDGYDSWASFFANDKAMYPTTPVNIKITSAYNETKKQYDIEVAVKYTQAVTSDNALHVFLSQDSIIDVQEYSPTVYDTAYVFNHVFRKALTDPIYGRTIAKGQNKIAGTVYIYRTSIAIDPADAVQQYWNASKMHVTAFVSIANDVSNFRILQAQQTELAP